MSRAGFHTGLGRGAVALTAATLLTAGCSSSGSGSSAGSGGVPKTLAQALRGVHATAATKAGLAWGEYGGAGSNDMHLVLAPILGFDPAVQPFVLTTGKPPTTVTVLYGTFDPTAIGAKFQALGYKKTDRGGGVTQWLIRDNHELDMNQQPEELALSMTTFNVVRVSKDRIIFGGATTDLDGALPAQSSSLADDPVIGQIAKCIDKAPSGEFYSGYAPDVDQVAVGIDPNGTETLCVAAPDDTTAKNYGTAFTQAITSGTSKVSLTPWKTMFTNPKVESLGGAGHVMRLTVTAVDAKHPQLDHALANMDVLGMLGKQVPDRKARPGDGSASPSGEASSSSG